MDNEFTLVLRDRDWGSKKEAGMATAEMADEMYSARS
jgi:hypothetical protein